MYTMSDEENKLLLHCYTSIKRLDAPVWLDISDGWSQLKGSPIL